jgi:hypothetical protein
MSQQPEPGIMATLREMCARLSEVGIAETQSHAILAAYDAIVAERDAAVRDAQVVREIRARRNVVVEVSAELLKNGAFTDQPLHIMLTENGDGTHLLTFRVSDTIRELRQQLDASQRFSDEAVRAHTECERRLREATTRLAACERVVEAAEAYVHAASIRRFDEVLRAQVVVQQAVHELWRVKAGV